MWPNPQETSDLVPFTEEILNGKPIFFALEDLSVKHKHFALKKKSAWKSSQENVILLKIFDRKKLPWSFKTHYRLYNYRKS